MSLQLPVKDATTHELLRALLAESQQQTQHLAFIAAGMHRLLKPPRPSGLQITSVGEDHTAMADFQKYDLSLDPIAPPHDVVTRRLTVTLDGAAQEPVDVTPGDGSSPDAFPQLRVPEGSAVKLEFVNIDNGGLSSEPLVHEFTADDTTPPPAPTGLSVTGAGEDHE